MKKESLLAYNLQFFAEDEAGAEEQEVATLAESDEAEVVEEPSEEEESEEEPEVAEPVIDKNAIAAAARREAEAKLKARDLEFARRFGHLKNPITGKSIESERDYFEALDAQETIKRNQELEEKGVDPSLIDEAIRNNPVVRQAEMVLEQQKQQMIHSDIETQIKLIGQIDPSVKSFNDLENSANKAAMLDLVSRGYSLCDAYKLANFDVLMGKKTAAAEQKAINQAKGKSHLVPTSSGTNVNDGLEDIPEKELSKWRAFFPEASAKELREKYNRARRK